MTEDQPAQAAPEVLPPRQERILRMVVEEFARSGAPVGSKHLAGQKGLDFASSTVRYELARLEELGFLDHPHTSAGRVPTDRGYRYYVDEILAREPPGPAPPTLAEALELGEMRRELDESLRRLADMTAQVTNLLALVTAPPPESATVRHVEVLVLQPQLVMVVVITSTGQVGKRIFAFDRVVDAGLADWASAFLNERLVGLSVGSRMLETRLGEPSLGATERRFLGAIAPALTELGDEEPGALYVGGQARFLSERSGPDLQDLEALMRALEERYALLALLRGALGRNELYLRIGAELPEPGLRGLSLVAANYGIARRNLGTVSLLGPRRMDYRLAIATVREAAAALSRFVEDVYD
jgi:heat-inducible transcriptional repressor